MSSSEDISKQNPLDIAAQAEADLNSYEAKTGTSVSDSTAESGVDQGVESKFANAGASVTYGSEVSGRTIPESQGGGIVKDTGKQTKDTDFEGEGGPEEKAALAEEERPGDQDVQGNVR